MLPRHPKRLPTPASPPSNAIHALDARRRRALSHQMTVLSRYILRQRVRTGVGRRARQHDCQHPDASLRVQFGWILTIYDADPSRDALIIDTAARKRIIALAASGHLRIDGIGWDPHEPLDALARICMQPPQTTSERVHASTYSIPSPTPPP
ncbi:hypothetical protein B0H19DRAFT_1385418 [Mycena capillaripes]|nr:hypothetical protein B0H19DRAFT_1385418 [Mycena capillaripes]